MVSCYDMFLIKYLNRTRKISRKICTRYYMYGDICIKFKSLTTLYCVTRQDVKRTRVESIVTLFHTTSLEIMITLFL